MTKGRTRRWRPSEGTAGPGPVTAPVAGGLIGKGKFVNLPTDAPTQHKPFMPPVETADR